MKFKNLTIRPFDQLEADYSEFVIFTKIRARDNQRIFYGEIIAHKFNENVARNKLLSTSPFRIASSQSFTDIDLAIKSVMIISDNIFACETSNNIQVFDIDNGLDAEPTNIELDDMWFEKNFPTDNENEKGDE